MTPKKAFYVMTLLISIVVILIGASAYFGNKILVQESTKLVDLKATNVVLGNQQVSLAQAKSEVEKYKGIEEITQSIVPQDKDQARAVREIVSLANESGINLKSVVFPQSNLGTKSSAPSDSAAESSPAPIISQAKPVDGIKGVYSLEVNIEPANNVTYYQFITFLSKLENNRRTAQVTRIKIDPKSANSANPIVTFSLTLNIFLKP